MQLRNHPALAFVALAIALSWSYWGVLLALGYTVEPGGGVHTPWVSHLPGLLGPALAGGIVAWWWGGRAAFGAWLRRGARWPRPWWRTLAWAASPGLAGLLVWAVLARWGAAWGVAWPEGGAWWHFPGIPQAWGPVAVVLAVLLVNGWGEEWGWRGYLTDTLLPTHSRWATTCWVATAWTLWHLPLFWLNASMAALVGPMLLGWVLGLWCGAFVLAQVYLATGRSVPAVALWHVLYNLVVATEAGRGVPAAALSTVVMAWGLVTGVRWWRAHRQAGRRRQTAGAVS